MSKTERQSFVGGAATLAAAVLLVKILGALYKIPITNILGSEGMGYFNSAYNIYNVLLTISTAGLPVALSKMVSEANTLGQQNQKRRIFHVAMATFFVLGLIGTLIMALWPNELAATTSKAEAWYCILALSPAVIGVCCESAFRGYSQGHGNMVPTAVSQVIEATSKLVLGLIIAIWMLQAGYSIAQAAGGTILGVSVGSLLGLAYLIVNHLRGKRRAAPARAADRPPSGAAVLGRIAKLGIPIMLGSSVLSIITLVDQTLIYSRLQNAVGYSAEWTNDLYGIYSSTMTLYNLPAALIVPVTTSVIPALSAAIARDDSGGIMKLISASARITVILALPMGVGLTVLSGPILGLVYGAQPDIAEIGAPLLAVLGVATVFVCLMLTTNAYLQAYGKVNVPIYTMLIGGAVKVAVNWTLVGRPDVNIHGAPIGTLLCFVVIVAINLVAIARILPRRPDAVAIFVKPFLATAVMGAAAWGVYGAVCRLAAALLGAERLLLVNGLGVAVAILIAVVLYAALILILGVISKEDMSMLPKGARLARVLRLR